METTSIVIKNIQNRWRITAVALGSALAMVLAPTAFAANTPTAIATISPTAAWEGDIITLDASGSHTNPSGGALTYLWQQQAGAAASPSDATAVMTTFIAPMVPLPALTQAVQFRVRVTDSTSPPTRNDFSTNVTTTVYASPGADAGTDVHVYEGTLVMLNGSATRVQPGATLSYTWTAPAGITLSDIHAQNPTFTAPSVGLAGMAYTFTLVVTEHVAGLAHDQNSAADSVTINVDNVNQPPTAQASTDPINIVPMAEVDENTDPVTLYGFASDPDGDAVTFTWTQVHDTTGAPLQGGDIAVTLSDNMSTTPTFTAPNLTTQSSVDLVFQLIVNDGHLNSGPDYATIRVLNTNDPPVAMPAATPASAFEGNTVTLDGSASNDPNMGDTLTYTWEQIGGEAVTLTPSGSNATFVAPSVSAMDGSITLDFQLTVSDGQLSDTKPISVTVSHVNLPPVADAGMTEMVPELSNACLDGSGSYDPEDGSAVSFHWEQLDGPSVTLDNPDTNAPCFNTPDVGPAGDVLHFQLTVTDSHGLSNSATVEVDVTYVNHPPTANAGDDQGVNESDTVHLGGSGSDPDNNPLTFTWSQLSGPAVTISDEHDLNATFTAPPVSCDGDVVVMRLTVNDGYGDVHDDVNINVANVNHLPTANAGGNQDVSEFEAVSLHGDGSDLDPEEVSSLTFQWMQTSGDPVALSGSGQDVSFTAPAIPGGDPNADLPLGFRLTVTDLCGGSTTADKTVRVVNIPHAPTAVAQGPPTANEGTDNVTLDGSGSSDPDFDPLTYVWEQTDGPTVTLVYGPGDSAHVMPMFVTPWVSADTPLKFKLTVSDPYGGTSSAYVIVNIINWHTPPDASHARADVPVLWPPDHKMALVHIVGVTKPTDDKIALTGVTQDEPTNGLGDGDTAIDAIMQVNAGGDDSVLLRAERSGNGNGRVYRVCFHIEDPEQDADSCVNVMVPKSKKTDAAIDSGQNYDSTH
jgi:hypothetical protein